MPQLQTRLFLVFIQLLTRPCYLQSFHYGNKVQKAVPVPFQYDLYMSNLDESMSKAHKLPNPTTSLSKKPAGAPAKSAKSQAGKTVKGSKQSGVDTDKSTNGYDTIADGEFAAKLTFIVRNWEMAPRILSKQPRAAREPVFYPMENPPWRRRCQATHPGPYLRVPASTARRHRTPRYPRLNSSSRRTRVRGASLSTNWQRETGHSNISRIHGWVPTRI